MLRLAADENFNNDMLRGLLRRQPELDVVRVQDVGLSGVHDSRVLEWAAGEGRVLLTHDVATLTAFAYERVSSGQRMPGVFEVGRAIPIGRAVIGNRPTRPGLVDPAAAWPAPAPAGYHGATPRARGAQGDQ